MIAFLPLFEALNWATVLDDYVRDRWRPEGNPLDWTWRDRIDDAQRKIVQGTRFVRNRVHHQWADALILQDGKAMLPFQFPITFFEWCWSAADRLPAGDRSFGKEAYRTGEEAYRTHLQEKPARHTLSVLKEVYHDMEVRMRDTDPFA